MKLTSFVLFAVTVGLTGCGQSFSASQSPSGSATNASSAVNSGTGGLSSAQQAFKDLQVDGTVAGGSDTLTQVISIDKTNMQLIVRLPIPLGTLSGASITPMPIQQIPGATIGLESNTSGGSSLALRIPLSAVMKGVSTLPVGQLPNGQPLPAIPDGELPELALNLTNLGNEKVAVYLSPTIVGIFVDSKFNPYIGLTLPIWNSAHTTQWGYFSSIPATTGYDGGFFVSVKLPDEVARVIDDVM